MGTGIHHEYEVCSGVQMSSPANLNIASLQTHIILPFRLWHDPEQCPFPQSNHKILDHAEQQLQGTAWQPFSSPKFDTDHLAEALKDYQAYSYFHPFVRRFWYSNTYLKRYLRSDVA